MARAVVFDTPGLIPVEAFTKMGVNSKPNSANPIGHFGTGLKYAIAVLMREGVGVTLWIGETRYSFYKRQTDFRGKSFDFIRMRKDAPSIRDRLRITTSHHDLPFTTELGKGWRLWQAYRELESNTLDEGGFTRVVDDEGDRLNVFDRTLIIVESEDFVQVHLDRDKVFLPGGLGERTGTERIQVLDRPSRHLYYRGLRVMDLPKPSLYTYNFLAGIELTEDRTVKYEFMAKHYLAMQVATSDDEGFIRNVLLAGDGQWEHGMAFDAAERPSEAFVRVVDRNKSSVHRGVRRYGAVWSPTYGRSASVAPDPPMKGLLDAYPLPWRRDDYGVNDADGSTVVKRQRSMPDHLWEAFADGLVEAFASRDPVEEDGDDEPAPPDPDEPAAAPLALTHTDDEGVPY